MNEKEDKLPDSEASECLNSYLCNEITHRRCRFTYLEPIDMT